MVAVIGIGLARQQAFELALGGPLVEFFERRFGLGDNFGIVLGLGQFDQLDVIAQFLFEFGEGGQVFFEPRPFAHHALRGLGILPQFGVFGAEVQVVEALLRCRRVKDASSAVPGTA